MSGFRERAVCWLKGGMEALTLVLVVGVGWRT